MDLVIIPVNNKHFYDLNPVSCGYQICKPKHTGGITMRDYYLVHYVKNGKGFFETEGVRYDIGPGEIFILYENQIGYYEADESDPWEYIWIGFNGELAKKLKTLDKQVMEFSGSVFEEIAESEKINDTRSEYLAGKLFEFISILFDKKGKQSYVEQVKDYVKLNYMLPLYVEDIAGMLNVNRRYLSRLFREEVGIPIKNYIINVKMNRAEQLLKQGFTVSNVAELVGYEDVFNFSKMYKKIKGCPPKNSREKKLEFYSDK